MTSLTASVVTTVSTKAHGGGVYFNERGVRPMGRGGAFVAGADDLGAIYYNPAGLVHASRQVMVEAGFVLMDTEFTRVARIPQVDPNTGEFTGQSWNRTYPKAKGTSHVLPAPTLAVSYDFGIEGAAFALGVWTPYAGLNGYDHVVAGEPNPGRYMMLDLKGSILVVPGVWAAYKILPQLSVGAGFEMMVGQIKAQAAVNGCLPDRWMCPHEAADYDFLARMNMGPVLAPSGNFGVQFDPHKNVRVGLAFQLPFHIDVATRPEGRIPSAAVFEKAYQDGDEARTEMYFPWSARVGVEARWPGTRVELAFVYDAWSMHDKVTITPKDIVYRDVLTLKDEYRVTPQSVPRGFRDTWSLRLGGEKSFDVGSYKIDARAGVMYERSAIPPEYLTTITIDLDKVVVGLGGSFHLSPSWRFDCMVARTFTSPVDVSPEEAKYELPSPVRANPTPPESRDYVNAGRYKASSTVLGVGFAANY